MAWGKQFSEPTPTPGGIGINSAGEFSGPQALTNIFQGAASGGMFDPAGSPYIRRLLRQQAEQDAMGRIGAASLSSGLYGGDDPYARIYGRATGEQGAWDQFQRNLTSADISAAEMNQQNIRAVIEQLVAAWTRKDPKKQADLGPVNSLISAGGAIGAAAL